MKATSAVGELPDVNVKVNLTHCRVKPTHNANMSDTARLVKYIPVDESLVLMFFIRMTIDSVLPAIPKTMKNGETIRHIKMAATYAPSVSSSV